MHPTYIPIYSLKNQWRIKKSSFIEALSFTLSTLDSQIHFTVSLLFLHINFAKRLPIVERGAHRPLPRCRKFLMQPSIYSSICRRRREEKRLRKNDELCEIMAMSGVISSSRSAFLLPNTLISEIYQEQFSGFDIKVKQLHSKQKKPLIKSQLFNRIKILS